MIPLVLGSLLLLAPQDTSSLWGRSGEKWDAKGRLPDFSHAGYRCGEQPIPRVPPKLDVRRFGARGDGKTDDTKAFLDAIKAAGQGAIFVPPGRYVITNILEIRKSGVVLKGAGPDKTVLFFPRTLHDIKPNMGATTGGRPTSNYSWSGGFVWLKGHSRGRKLADATPPARRGDTQLRVSKPGGLRPGMEIEITQRDRSDNSLARHLYANDPGDMKKLHGRTRTSQVCSIREVRGGTLLLDRPLRCDLKKEWTPEVRGFTPSVTNSGVEDLAFEFPVTPYRGHFTEKGFNAIALSGVVHCWVRNVVTRNADSGIFASGRFCTIRDVRLESSRPAHGKSKTVGHHGVYLTGNDNLLTKFEIRTRYIHDITVSHCTGNVISEGKGEDLSLDHHKRVPYANLFTALDAGAGTRLWSSGGGGSLGRHCGGWETFWNIRAARPQKHPGGFGPASMNLVAVQPGGKSVLDPKGKWFEAIAPDKIRPSNLHRAQLERRLGRKIRD
jgi:hypothetical protein